MSFLAQNSKWLHGSFVQDKEEPRMLYYNFTNIFRFRILFWILITIESFILSYFTLNFVSKIRTPIIDLKNVELLTSNEKLIAQLLLMAWFIGISYWILWSILVRKELFYFIHHVERKIIVIPEKNLDITDKNWAISEGWILFCFQHLVWTYRFVITDMGYKRLLELFKSRKEVHLKEFLKTEKIFELFEPLERTNLIGE